MLFRGVLISLISGDCCAGGDRFCRPPVDVSLLAATPVEAGDGEADLFLPGGDGLPLCGDLVLFLFLSNVGGGGGPRTTFCFCPASFCGEGDAPTGEDALRSSFGLDLGAPSSFVILSYLFVRRGTTNRTYQIADVG